MPLTPPKLDDRDYRSLVEEAKQRIPTFTGEWTNFNDNDPGMALVQLHAWLTETLLWRVNRLPDLAYINMLNLLGVEPEPARAASAEVSFKLKKLDSEEDPLTVIIPKAVSIGVDDPDLASPITFETDSSIRAINAAIASIIVPADEAGQSRLVGQYDPDAAELVRENANLPFRAFGDASGPAEMRVGLLLRPYRNDKDSYFHDRFPEGELDLAVFVPEVHDLNSSNETIEGPFGQTCLFPWEVSEQGSDVVWEVYTGTNPSSDWDNDASWTELVVRGDDTAGLRRSGHIYLDIPSGLSAHPYSSLSRGQWDGLGLDKPPTTNAELIGSLSDRDFVPADLSGDVWKNQLKLASPTLSDTEELVAEIVAHGTALDFGAVEPETWTELGFSPIPAPHGLIWIRARLTQARDNAPEISAIRLNTVRATAATTRTTETLGISAGRPNQTFRTKRSPILIDPSTGEPSIEIELIDSSGTRREMWEREESFFGAGRDTNRYHLDPETGTVTFGDGVNGRIPVAGTRIVATGYRVGGGTSANVAANTITSLKTALPQIDSVSNIRAAAGGYDVETLEEVKLRAPQLLRTRERAVSAEDFADLALRTPGVELKSAFVLPRVALDHSSGVAVPVPNTAGAVTVVVLPVNPDPMPQPSEEQLRMICAWLNERRLVTTELYVTGPRYLSITGLEAEILISSDADIKDVDARCNAALRQYFHPLFGGDPDPDTGVGKGWPIGGDIYLGNVFERLLAQEGVMRVASLDLGTEDQPIGQCLDRLAVPDGTLVHLPEALANLKVRYHRVP